MARLPSTIRNGLAAIAVLCCVTGNSHAQLTAENQELLRELGSANPRAAGVATFNKGNANTLMPGMGVLPAGTGAYSTIGNIGSLGADRLAYCVSKPTAELTEFEKAQCNAALMAADISTQHATDGTVGASPANTWQAEAVTNAKQRMALDPTISSKGSDLYSTQQETCIDTAADSPGTAREQQTCSIGFDSSPQTCSNTLTVRVTNTYTITGTDPQTGNTVTYGQTTEQAEASQIQASNPGSTIQSTSSQTDTWGSSCASLDSNPQCDFDGEVCSIGPLEQTINGQSVTRSCWEKTRGYTCYSATSSTTCSGLQNSGCTIVGQDSCVEQRPNGQCVQSTRAFSCSTTMPGAGTTRKCSGGKLCVGDACFNTSKTASKDFAVAISYLEASRQGMVYADGKPANLALFRGEMSSCTKPVGPGIGKNCCKVSGGALNNHQVLGATTNSMIGGTSATTMIVAGVVTSTVAKNVINIGTHYTYDFMMNAGGYFGSKATNAILEGAFDPTAGLGDLLSGPSFSQYGFSLSTSAPIFDSTMTLAKGIGGTNYNLTFNPYIFAAMVAISIYKELNSCSIDMEMLAKRRGTNLCAYIGSYCSMRLPRPLRTCLQETEQWCCWNSKLSMAIANQGKCQLGACGAASACGGMTPEELARVDFSKLDLSEFMADIAANARNSANIYSPANVEQVKTHIGSTAIQNPASLAIPIR